MRCPLHNRPASSSTEHIKKGIAQILKNNPKLKSELLGYLVDAKLEQKQKQPQKPKMSLKSLLGLRDR